MLRLSFARPSWLATACSRNISIDCNPRLPGESSKPSAEEFIGKPGLVGIYYGHLPRDGRPRQKVTLVLFADPKSGSPKEYTLERIGVGKVPNARYITKGTWKL